MCQNECGGCPFNYASEESEMAQNYGCLPTPCDIAYMRERYGKTWACHDNPSTPCTGAITELKARGLPYKVINKELVTEQSEWHLYAVPRDEYYSLPPREGDI